MAHVDIAPKFVKIDSGKRLVVLDEDEFERLLDAVELSEAQQALHDKSDPEIDWQTASKELIKNRIALVRAAKGLSQRQLAERLGVKPSTVSRWERPDANLTLETLRKIAAAIDCGVHDLIA